VLNLLTKRVGALHLGHANYCWFTDPSRALCLKLAGTPHADLPWPRTGPTGDASADPRSSPSPGNATFASNEDSVRSADSRCSMRTAPDQ
jgi:hypothetical protein